MQRADRARSVTGRSSSASKRTKTRMCQFQWSRSQLFASQTARSVDYSISELASRRLRLTRTCRGVKYLEELDMVVSASVIRLVLDKGCMPPTRWGSVCPDELFYTCALAASGLKLVWQLPHKPLSGQSFVYTWLIHHDSFCHPVRPSRNRISHLLLPTSTAAASSKSLSLEDTRQLLHGRRVISHR